MIGLTQEVAVKAIEAIEAVKAIEAIEAVKEAKSPPAAKSPEIRPPRTSSHEPVVANQ